jgi:hypothetical protein
MVALFQVGLADGTVGRNITLTLTLQFSAEFSVEEPRKVRRPLKT